MGISPAQIIGKRHQVARSRRHNILLGQVLGSRQQGICHVGAAAAAALRVAKSNRGKQAIGHDHGGQFVNRRPVQRLCRFQRVLGPDLFEVFHGVLPEGFDAGILFNFFVRSEDRTGEFQGGGDDQAVGGIAVDARQFRGAKRDARGDWRFPHLLDLQGHLKPGGRPVFRRGRAPPFRLVPPPL